VNKKGKKTMREYTPRKIVVAASALIFAVSLSACGDKKELPAYTGEPATESPADEMPDTDKISAAALSYMSGKYHEEFEITAVTDKNTGGANLLFTAEPKIPMPLPYGKPVYVTYIVLENGEERFMDNLLSLRYDNDVREMAEDILSEAFGECFVSTSPTPILSGDGFTAWDEYVSDPASLLAFAAVVPETGLLKGKKAIEEALADKIAEYGAAISGTVFAAKDTAPVSLSELTDETYPAFVSDERNVIGKVFFAAMTAGELTMIDWDVAASEDPAETQDSEN
jgi:hypothetical protein